MLDIAGQLLLTFAVLLFVSMFVAELLNEVKDVGHSLSWQELAPRYLAQVTEESLARAQQHWQRADRTIRFGPIKAVYYGDQPDILNCTLPDVGVLAIVDDRLIFRSASSANFEIDLSLESIRWFGQSNDTIRQASAVTVYVERASRWSLYVVGVEDVELVARAMQEIGGIALNPDPDYGPVNTMRYDQNIDGHWVRDHTVRLYLIPDHLLADWRTAVRFNQVQELAVQSSGDFNPHDSTLLSIRCTSDDGRSRGVGFALSWDKAFELASLLEQHTGVVFEKVECKKEVG